MMKVKYLRKLNHTKVKTFQSDSKMLVGFGGVLISSRQLCTGTEGVHGMAWCGLQLIC